MSRFLSKYTQLIGVLVGRQPSPRETRPSINAALELRERRGFHTGRYEIQLKVVKGEDLPEVFYQGEIRSAARIGWDVHSIIFHLLENCADHAGCKKNNFRPRVILRSYREGEYACVDVEDDGPGIPEDLQERMLSGKLFIESSLSRAFRFARSLGGIILASNIRRDSEVIGARFTVKIPLSEELRTLEHGHRLAEDLRAGRRYPCGED